MHYFQVPDLDAILVPTGGGGMLAGIAVTAHSMQPKCQGKKLKSPAVQMILKAL